MEKFKVHPKVAGALSREPLHFRKIKTPTKVMEALAKRGGTIRGRYLKLVKSSRHLANWEHILRSLRKLSDRTEIRQFFKFRLASLTAHWDMPIDEGTLTMRMQIGIICRNMKRKPEKDYPKMGMSKMKAIYPVWKRECSAARVLLESTKGRAILRKLYQEALSTSENQFRLAHGSGGKIYSGEQGSGQPLPLEKILAAMRSGTYDDLEIHTIATAAADILFKNAPVPEKPKKKKKFVFRK